MAYVISDDCTACGTCIDECPVEAISEGDIYVIDAEACTDCGASIDINKNQNDIEKKMTILLLKKV